MQRRHLENPMHVHDTTLKKLGVEQNFLNLTKDIYKKPTASIILYWSKTECFPPKTGNKQRHLLVPLLFNTVLEVLASSIRQE